MDRSHIETLAAGRFLRLVSDRGWEYAERARGSGVVAVVAVTGDDELVLTEQYRPPVKKRVIDLPAGLVGDADGDEDEVFETAAERELLEETGYRGEHFVHAFTGPPSAGMSSEMVAFYIARGVRRISDGGGDETEEIQVHVVPLREVHSWLKQHQTPGTCLDPKVYAALGLLAGDSSSLDV